MRILTIDGRLGKDAEMKKTQNGKEFITFSIANNTYVKGEEKTVWYDISLFSVEAYHNRMQYFTKGSYVSVTGVPDESAYQTRDGQLRVQHSLLADRVEFLKSGKKEGSENEQGNDNNVQRRSNVDEGYINPVVNTPNPSFVPPTVNVAPQSPYPSNISEGPKSSNYTPPTSPNANVSAYNSAEGDDLPF